MLHNFLKKCINLFTIFLNPFKWVWFNLTQLYTFYIFNDIKRGDLIKLCSGCTVELLIAGKYKGKELDLIEISIEEFQLHTRFISANDILLVVDIDHNSRFGYIKVLFENKIWYTKPTLFTVI